MEELRRFPRLDIDVHIEWKKMPLSEEKSNFEDIRGLGSTRNVSAGGVCFSIDEVKGEKLESGNVLDIIFELPTNESIKVLGKIKWINKLDVMKEHDDYIVGVEFLDIASKDRALLAKFVKDRFIFKKK